MHTRATTIAILMILFAGTLGCIGQKEPNQQMKSESNNVAPPPSSSSVPLSSIMDPRDFAAQLQQTRNPHIMESTRYFYQRRTGTKLMANNAAPPGAAMDFNSQAYPLMAALWASPVINVCWENPSIAFGNQMQEVQQAVLGTWQAASKLKFTGWLKCPQVSNAGDQVIRIFIDDSSSQNGPRTLGLGNQIAGVPQGMLLNFTFLRWGTNCQTMVDYCIKAIAVHEFGHAIGFSHEQNRPDTPGECMQAPQGTNGDNTLLTPYDPDSVMNYCNKKYNNDGHLSSLDKEAVMKLYGAP